MIALNDAFQPEAGRVTDAERRALTDPDVIEETRRLRALGLGPVEALRIAARSVRQSSVPAGRATLAPPAQHPPSYSERCAPAGAFDAAHGCWESNDRRPEAPSTPTRTPDDCSRAVHAMGSARGVSAASSSGLAGAGPFPLRRWLVVRALVVAALGLTALLGCLLASWWWAW